MERARVKDGLIGAGITLLVLLLVVVILFWWVSDPADEDAQGAPSPTAGADVGDPQEGSAGTGEPPADLGDDEVWLADLVLDAGTVATADSLLHDVHAVGQDVRTGQDGLVAGEVSVEATVPFDVVADQLGGGSVVGPGRDGRAVVERTVELLGREIDVVASGTVEVDGGRLVVVPRSIDLGGPGFLSGLIAAAVRELVTIEHEIEGLPEGLVLQDVTVQEDGFRAELHGQDVRLVP